MPFFVYILYSDKLRRFYTGTTDNVPLRLEQHNNAVYEDSFSVKGMPWTLFYVIECSTSRQAYMIEKHVKKMKSSRYIGNLKIYPEISKKLLVKYLCGLIPSYRGNRGSRSRERKPCRRLVLRGFFVLMSCRYVKTVFRLLFLP